MLQGARLGECLENGLKLDGERPDMRQLQEAPVVTRKYRAANRGAGIVCPDRALLDCSKSLACPPGMDGGLDRLYAMCFQEAEVTLDACRLLDQVCRRQCRARYAVGLSPGEQRLEACLGC